MPPQLETMSCPKQALRNMRVTAAGVSSLLPWKAATSVRAAPIAPTISQLRRRIQKSVIGLQRK